MFKSESCDGGKCHLCLVSIRRLRLASAQIGSVMSLRQATVRFVEYKNEKYRSSCKQTGEGREDTKKNQSTMASSDASQIIEKPG